MIAATAALAAGLAVVAAFELLSALDGRRVLAGVESALAPLRAAGRAGCVPADGERRRLVLTAAAVTCGAGWLVAGALGAGLLGLLGPPAAVALVALRRARWRSAMACGAAPAALALADALAGGHAVSGALEVAARDGALPPAARVALGSAAGAIAVGEPLPAALGHLADRTGPGGWRAIVAAILVQRETGGDLARLLRELADGLARQARAEANARGASAQARLTARIVVLLPAAALALLAIAAPDALGAIAASPAALLLATAAVVLQALALLAVWAIARGVER
ncbi:MAG: type II secretion system F family protein [Solirubrobacteraceae bacterium]|nr:type II secretion system F family protein [Solirubrobacteraceae bacterium]